MSNSVIGALRVNLGLDSAQFSRGARRASSSLDRMRSQFRAVAGVAVTVGAALGALTVRVSAVADEINRFSQISNALPGEFQRWSAAAATVGIQQEKLADILKDVNDRVGDFLSTGGGPMADFFENIAPRVGITADAFRDLSGPQALQLYVTSLEQAGVSQQEMTFYLEAMASDTTALIPLLRDGGAAMAELGDNAESLGAVMSDEAVASLRGFRLAMADVGLAMQGLGYRIAESVVPSLTLLANAFADSMRDGGLLRTALDALIANIDVLAASLAVATTAFGVRFVGALLVAKLGAFSLVGALAALKTALITTGIGALIVGAGYLVAQFGRLSSAVGGFGDAMSMVKDLAVEVLGRISQGWQGTWEIARAAALGISATWVEAAARIARPYQTLFNFLANGFNQLAGLTGISVTAPTAGFADGLQAVADGLRSRGLEAAGAAGDAFRGSVAPLETLRAMRDVIRENAEAAEDAGAAAEELNSELNDLGGGAGAGGGGGSAGAASDALEEATTFTEGLREAFEGARRSAADLGRAVGEALVSGVDSLANAVGDFIAGGLRDFPGFLESILRSFQQFLSQMIAMAARNRIMIGLGIGGAGGGPALAGQAVGGQGLLGRLLGLGGGGGGGLLGSFGSGGSILGLGGLAGGSGLLGGFGNALSGGLGGILNIGGNAAAAGGGVLATLGAAAPIIGAVGLAFAAFRTKTKELDNGIQATITRADTLVNSFRTVEKSRFFGLSKRVKTTLGAASDDTTDYIQSSVAQLQEGVVNAASALGVGAEAFNGFQYDLRVSLRGLSEDQAQQALEDALRGAADAMASMVPGLAQFTQQGEGASEALDRLSASLSSVNAWMENLGLTVYEVSLASAAASSAFAEMFGGLEGFTQSASAYYAAFYTDAERTARATDLLRAELNALGIDALPGSRMAFRALVEEADAIGDTDLVASLIQLAPAFAEITAGADELNRSLNNLANQDLFATGQDYVRGLSRAVNGIEYTPQQSEAELRAMNAALATLVSTSEFIAANTGKTADAAEDQLGIALGQPL